MAASGGCRTALNPCWSQCQLSFMFFFHRSVQVGQEPHIKDWHDYSGVMSQQTLEL